MTGFVEGVTLMCAAMVALVVRDGGDEGDAVKKSELPRPLRRYAAFIQSVSDERAMGEGYWVNLRDGWCCDPATHTIHEDTPDQCARYFPVVPCECCDACATASAGIHRQQIR